MKIIVLGGAGAMGSGIVRDLVSEKSSGVDKVIVGDNRIDKAEALVGELNDDRLEAKLVDVSDKEKTKEILENIDVCVNCIPTLAGFQMDITEMCLESECSYMDLGGLYHVTTEQKKLHEKFAEKGVSGVLAMGSAPGITNVLAKHAADQCEKVEKIELYWAGKSMGEADEAGPDIPLFIPPYSIYTLIDEFAAETTQFIDGEEKTLPPCSSKKVLTFPEPVGKVATFHTIHSEPATLPKSYEDKGIEKVTWRLWPTERLNDIMRSLVSTGFGRVDSVEVGGKEIDPVRFLDKLIQKNAEENEEYIIEPDTVEEAQGYSMYRALVVGEKDGKKKEFTVDAIRPPHELFESFSEADTSIPASICAQMLGSGDIDPGLWAPEEAVDSVKFFSELGKRHFKIVSREEEGLG